MDSLEDLSRRAAVAQNQGDPTRARPQPWFVGSGRQLTLAVIAIVVALLAVRAVTTMWLVEEAWTWSTVQPFAPGFIRDYPHAPRPIDRARWITSADYPFAPEEYSILPPGGRQHLIVALSIDADGRVTDCWPELSSQSGRLDDRTCDLLRQRASFEPARDSTGHAIAGEVRQRVRWAPPAPPPTPLRRGDMLRTVDLSPDDRVISCHRYVDGRDAGITRSDPCLANDAPVRVRRLTGLKGPLRIALRSVVAQGEPGFMPIPRTSLLLFESVQRAVLQPDGTLRDCSMKLGGIQFDNKKGREATLCEFNRRWVFEGRKPDRPIVLRFMERVSVRRIG